ncbi:MAG: hypothetical protein V3W18_07015 [candidate division Zixibacteria bacterium]
MNEYVTLLLDLATEVEQFPLTECSLSDDLEKHWVYIAAFKNTAIRFIGASKFIDDARFQSSIAGVNVNSEYIGDAYDVQAELIAIIYYIREKAKDPSWGQITTNAEDFVEFALIDRISSLNPRQFNVSKLARFAQELNENYKRGNYLSCALLIRAIINHVPPIFEQRTFKQVVAHSSKSVKAILFNLEEGARDIGDLHTHEIVDKFSAPPSKNQIDPYKPNIDVLFREIERKLSC